MSEQSRGFNFDTVDHMIAEGLEENDEAMKNIPGVIGNVIAKPTIEIQTPDTQK